ALNRNPLVLAKLALAEVGQVVKVESHIIGNEEIKVSVVIIIHKRRASGPARVAHARLLGDVCKGPVAIVLKEMIGPETGDIKVVKAVVIVVTDGHSHPPADVAHARLISYIGERAVAIVVVQGALSLSLRLYQVDGQRIDEVDVRVAIIVVVDERQPAAH